MGRIDSIRRAGIGGLRALCLAAAGLLRHRTTAAAGLAPHEHTPTSVSVVPNVRQPADLTLSLAGISQHLFNAVHGGKQEKRKHEAIFQ
ncbi:hypothetical protein ACJ51O_25040 [Burkholderia pyrrocinia]|uniref:hypothetical protein n=1 Tax=Burkholderia pyrrocinia TaxID=60550 RepID=UPI0038B4FF38